MAYSNIEDVNYWAAKSLAEDYASVNDWIDVRNVSIGSFYLTWADAAATDAVVKLQQSHSKTDTAGIDIASKTVTIGAGCGCDQLGPSQRGDGAARVVVVIRVREGARALDGPERCRARYA